jgi:hypothetical protein
MPMKEDLKILRYGFSLKYGKLRKLRAVFQNSKLFKKLGRMFNPNLSYLVKNPDLGILSKFEKFVS